MKRKWDQESPPASDRQVPWPRYADQARRQTIETTENYAELLAGVLEHVQQIGALAYTNPEAVRALTIAIERDVALTIAALRSIQAWMEAAKRGKEG